MSKQSTNKSTSKTVQTRTRSTSKPGKKDEAPSAATSTLAQKVPYPCVECKITVQDNVDAMECCFCKQFTHLTCDGRVSQTLYKALAEDVDNALLYLCKTCKPLILPDDAHNLWQTFLGKIEPAILDITAKEPLANKIMNKLSDKIEQLDAMVKDHRKLFVETQSTHETRGAEIRESIINMLSHQSSSSTPSNTHAPQRTQQTHPRPMPPHIQGKPSYSEALSSQCNNMPQPINSTAPPRLPLPTKPPEPNIETTVVVYNTNKSERLHVVIEDLMLSCNMYHYEIAYANYLGKSNSNGSPIYVNCDHPRTKWNFLRALNNLKTKYDGYETLYARPYMTAEDLKADRDLVRKLTDLRTRFPGRKFKINRGEIKELLNNKLILFEPADLSTTEHSFSSQQSSFSSLPRLEDAVLDAQQIQSSSPARNDRHEKQQQTANTADNETTPAQHDASNTSTHGDQ